MTAAKFLLVALLSAGLAWKYGFDALDTHLKTALPIKYVRTEGVFQYLSKDEVKTALEPLVKTGFLILMCKSFTRQYRRCLGSSQ